MKVGFIVECGPEGAETKVIPMLAKAINAKIEPDVVPLDKKPKLKTECGKWAKKLIEGGCVKVVIIWDLLPDWGEYDGKGCRHEDRNEIFASLAEAGFKVNDKRIKFVCIEKMLESWIIADERALSHFLSTPAHKVGVKRQKSPENIPDPKAALIDLFRKSKSHFNRYVDYVHAFPIAQRAVGFGLPARLGKLETFNRFRASLA